MPALARLAVYQLRSSATSPVASASSGPARRMPKNSSRRLRLIARMATEGPLTGDAERGGQAKYLLWQSYGDIPPEVRSEERRVGEECVRPGRTRWSPDH